ncbi:dihydrodipicolinate synthase family protein [Amycolatopsis sp. NPDC057786]|uniref:dihydrodipicolinate synthase family protein n=1 Tax=Amycolatopsis sp. NPDC057786 TaxID=3346250 RepID=UPI00366B9954
MVQKFGVDDVRGVVAVAPTPALPGAAGLTARDTVDLGESDRMIRALVADGVDGIITNGTLGEMATLTLDEWKAFAACVADAVSDTAPDLPLFVGATTPNTRDTLDRIRFLRDLGVRGVLLGRPMWSALGADALLAFYRGVADLFPEMAIVLYDNPEAFKGPIPSAVYAELAKLPQIIGAKYIAITPKFTADVAAVGGRIRLLPLESDWLAAHTLHPETTLGCWSSSALCGPRPVLALRDAIRSGDVDAARHLTHRIEWTYEPFLARTNFPEFSKYNISLEKLRFDEAGYVTAGPARPPYHVVPEAYAEGARENGRRWRLLVGEVRRPAS